MTEDERTHKLYVGCDNVVEVDELKNELTGSYMNSATVTFDVFDSDGVAVSDAAAVSMSYVAASNGKYQGVLESAVALVEGNFYTVVVSIVQGNIVDQRRWEALACYRTDEDVT